MHALITTLPANTTSAWLHQWATHINTSFMYYGADQLNERRFEKKMNFRPDSSLTLALVWRYRIDDEALTWDENLYDSPSHYYLSVELEF